MSVSGVQSCNFSGIFISTWSQTAGLKHFSLIRKVSLIKCHAYRWSRGEAGTAEGVGGGRRGGIWKPTEFVISRVMQDVWQLVRILTVLSVAWLPSWQVVIWALEGFHWLPLASLMRLWSFISGPQQWGTPKLLVGHVVPIGVSTSTREDESLPLFPVPNVLCARQPRRWVSAFVLHWTTHAHMNINTASRTCARAHFQTPTDTLCWPQSLTHPVPNAPMCSENFSKHPKLCVRNDEKRLAFRRSFITRLYWQL